MNSKISRLIIILSLLALPISGCAGGASAPSSHIDVNNLQLQWTVDIDEAIGWPPVTINDTLVIMPLDSPLMALKAETGAKDWQLDTPAIFWGESLSATLDDVLLPGQHGRLIALRPKSGIAEWEIKLDGEVFATPYLDRYVLFTPTSEIDGSEIKNGTLYSINASTGKTLWLYKTARKDLLTPARGNDLVFVAGNTVQAGTIYAISAAEGLLRWESDLDERIISIFANDEIVVALGDQGNLIGLDPQSGDSLWRQKGAKSGQHLLGWNNLFFISGSNFLEARENQTGSFVWQFENDADHVDQPIVIGNELILLNSSGEIISLNSEDGRELGRFATGSTAPKGFAIHQNWLFIAESAGIVYGFAQP